MSTIHSPELTALKNRNKAAAAKAAADAAAKAAADKEVQRILDKEYNYATRYLKRDNRILFRKTLHLVLANYFSANPESAFWRGNYLELWRLMQAHTKLDIRMSWQYHFLNEIGREHFLNASIPEPANDTITIPRYV